MITTINMKIDYYNLVDVTLFSVFNCRSVNQKEMFFHIFLPHLLIWEETRII